MWSGSTVSSIHWWIKRVHLPPKNMDPLLSKMLKDASKGWQRVQRFCPWAVCGCLLKLTLMFFFLVLYPAPIKTRRISSWSRKMRCVSFFAVRFDRINSGIRQCTVRKPENRCIWSVDCSSVTCFRDLIGSAIPKAKKLTVTSMLVWHLEIPLLAPTIYRSLIRRLCKGQQN